MLLVSYPRAIKFPDVIATPAGVSILRKAALCAAEFY